MSVAHTAWMTLLQRPARLDPARLANLGTDDPGSDRGPGEQRRRLGDLGTQSHQVIVLATTGQLGMAATRQITADRRQSRFRLAAH
jgi:hypothetical protein